MGKGPRSLDEIDGERSFGELIAKDLYFCSLPFLGSLLWSVLID